EETYFREVLGLSSLRTAYKRFAIGRMLSAFAEPARPAIRAALAEVGVAKATVIVPGPRWPASWRTQCSRHGCRRRWPRCPEVWNRVERFRRAVLSAMPDIEAMAVVEWFFAIEAKVVGSAHPVGIFLAGCGECLAEWEVQAARGRTCSP